MFYWQHVRLIDFIAFGALMFTLGALFGLFLRLRNNVPAIRLSLTGRGVPGSDWGYLRVDIASREAPYRLAEVRAMQPTGMILVEYNLDYGAVGRSDAHITLGPPLQDTGAGALKLPSSWHMRFTLPKVLDSNRLVLALTLKPEIDGPSIVIKKAIEVPRRYLEQGVL
jgi:hypothetical protein